MPRSRSFDPLVFTSKTVFLQRVQEAVNDGYRYYVSGSVPLESAPSLVRKFRAAYQVDVDKNERYRRKAAGLGNARLLMRFNEEQRIDFLLLLTPGVHPAHQLEKLRDVQQAPLAYRELELVALTFKGRSKPSLTWRFDAATVASWRHRLHLCTAHYDKLQLFRAWHSLYRTPGFAGIRRQVGELVSYWRGEWRKLRGDAPCPICYPHNDYMHRERYGVKKGEDGMYWTERGFPSPAQLPKLFYVRKQADIGERLSAMLRGHV